MRTLIFALLLLVVAAAELFAQSPMAYHRAFGSDVEKPKGPPSPYNPNLADLNLGFAAIGNTPGLGRDFYPVGNLRHEFVLSKEDKILLPVFANIGIPNLSLDSLAAQLSSLNDLLTREDGLAIGFYPYKIIIPRGVNGNDRIYFVLNGELSFRYNVIDLEGDKEQRMNVGQWRFGLGIEYGFKMGIKQKYFTVGASLVYSTVSEEALKSIVNEDYAPLLLEVSALCPVGNKFLLGGELLVSLTGTVSYGLGINFPLSTKSREQKKEERNEN